MKEVTEDMQKILPTDFDFDIGANVKSAMNSLGDGMAGADGGAGGFSLVLHIGTFINQTTQDIRQLADELSTIMAGEIRRRGLVK